MVPKWVLEPVWLWWVSAERFSELTEPFLQMLNVLESWELAIYDYTNIKEDKKILDVESQMRWQIFGLAILYKKYDFMISFSRTVHAAHWTVAESFILFLGVQQYSDKFNTVSHDSETPRLIANGPVTAQVWLKTHVKSWCLNGLIEDAYKSTTLQYFVNNNTNKCQRRYEYYCIKLRVE